MTPSPRWGRWVCPPTARVRLHRGLRRQRAFDRQPHRHSCPAPTLPPCCRLACCSSRTSTPTAPRSSARASQWGCVKSLWTCKMPCLVRCSRSWQARTCQPPAHQPCPCPPHSCSYANQIKRCDEMARQLRFFTSEVEKAGIMVAPRLSSEQVGWWAGVLHAHLDFFKVPCRAHPSLPLLRSLSHLSCLSHLHLPLGRAGV